MLNYITLKNRSVFNISEKIQKPEPWVGTKDIAEHLGVKIDTVRAWIKSGKIHCNRVSKLWMFRISEVDLWVMSSRNEEKET